MTARWNSRADPRHIGSACFRERDTPSLNPLPRRTTSPPPKPWSQSRLRVCEQRTARTKPSLPPNKASRFRPPNKASRLRAWIFDGPACALPDIYLKTAQRNSRRGRNVGSAFEHGGLTPYSQLNTRL